jgi:hypothetical protein
MKVTLKDIFRHLDGLSFSSRSKLEKAVCAAFNVYVGRLPVEFSYKDAIDGALERGWLKTKRDRSPGVKVVLS